MYILYNLSMISATPARPTCRWCGWQLKKQLNCQMRIKVKQQFCPKICVTLGNQYIDITLCTLFQPTYGVYEAIKCSKYPLTIYQNDRDVPHPYWPDLTDFIPSIVFHLTWIYLIQRTHSALVKVILMYHHWMSSPVPHSHLDLTPSLRLKQQISPTWRSVTLQPRAVYLCEENIK